MKLSLVPLARTTFDVALAKEVAARVRSRLQNAGFSLTGPEKLLTDLHETKAAAQALADDPPDLLLVLQATFADSTMVLSLAETVNAPLLLWAVPEERTGGRLRLNSFCGINLGAHALRRHRHKYDYVYAAADDPAALEKVRTLALAGRARRLLQQARIGRVGENPDGLDTCDVDRAALTRRLGLDVVQISLDKTFEVARTADPQEVEAVHQKLSGRLDGLQALDQAALRRTLSSYVALRQLAERQGLAGLAVRCWPEFFTELGCAACGAMSMLSDELTPCSCEADVNGTITQLILQWLSGEPAFGTDVVSFDLEEDAAVVWHCGLAPLSMADPQVRPRATIHSNRELPLLMEFPLKPGRVTVARLSEATGDYRLVVGGGEMLRAPMSFTGTSGLLRFDRPARQVLDVMLGEGLEHHVSLTYGDHVPTLLTLSKMLNLPVLRL
ncbi:MAG: L-fucose/L-arabinose isomerase family protein [Anaerolineae bacterium]